MIIAISGKKQSGKDLTGKIIQYLTSNYYKSELSKRNRILSSEEIDFKNFFITNKQFNCEIKKFADKLKDIVALLIGCTRKQLEDEEFKNIELEEEWWVWRLTYLGKTKFFNTKEETHKYRDDNFYGAGITELIKPTPRFLLQYLGTDLLRNQLHPDIWVNSLMNEYKPLNTLLQVNIITGKFKNTNVSVYPNWIITDIRFPNELKAVKDRDGITIRVNRCKSLRLMPKSCPNCGSSDELMYERFSNEIVCHNCSEWSLDLNKEQEHYSETALDDAKFDYVIDNNGTIEELIEKVKEILIEEKIL